jgi:hypothetical protein
MDFIFSRDGPTFLIQVKTLATSALTKFHFQASSSSLLKEAQP